MAAKMIAEKNAEKAAENEDLTSVAGLSDGTCSSKNAFFRILKMFISVIRLFFFQSLKKSTLSRMQSI